MPKWWQSCVISGNGLPEEISGDSEARKSQKTPFWPLAFLMHSPLLMNTAILTFFLLINLSEDLTEPDPSEKATYELSEDEIDKIFSSAQEDFAGVEGLRLRQLSNGNILLSGSILRLSDFKKVQAFKQKFPMVIDQSIASEGMLNQVEQDLRKKIKDLGMSGTLKRRGTSFSLCSRRSSKILSELRSIYPKVKAIHEAAPPEMTKNSGASIFLEILFVEIRKSALKKLGARLGSPLGFQTDGNFSLLPVKAIEAGGNLIDPIRIFLDLAAQNGQARIHSKESIVARNGQEGKFRAGGSFFIRASSKIREHITEVDYGLELKFTPHLLPSRMIRLDIDSKMDELDTTSSVDGLPGLSKKHLQTQIDAEPDQMVAIGGVVHSAQTKMTDAIPGLASLPVLGQLFRSEDFRHNRSEAYIFITPRIMKEAWLPSPEL